MRAVDIHYKVEDHRQHDGYTTVQQYTIDRIMQTTKKVIPGLESVHENRVEHRISKYRTYLAIR